jgi:hypothetical protein
MVASFSTLESQALAANQSGQSGPPKCWQDNCAKKKETTTPQHRFADFLV